MKDKKIFDILEDAENESMDRLIDKCPEISDEQLDRILDMSERKFNMKKADKNLRDTNIKMTDSAMVVEGVERSKRPAWIAPLSTAASLVLVAGIVIGSTALIKKNSKKPGNEGIVPQGATVSTTLVTGTESATVTTQPVTGDEYTYLDPDSTDLAPFAGKWKFIASETNNVDVDGKTIGYVEINTNGTYTLTGTDGSVETGDVKRGYEEIGGTKVIKLDFYGGKPIESGSYYLGDDLDTLHFGNGDAARLIRVKEETTTEKVDVKTLAGTWSYMELDQAYLPDNKVKAIGTLKISEDGTYTYKDSNGTITTGTVDTGIEMIADSAMQTVNFLENGEFKFGGYYNWGWDTISVGNGGLAYLCRTSDAAVSVNVDDILGEWNYQVADEGAAVNEWSHLQGTVDIKADATYTFTDLDGNSTEGRIEIKYEGSGEFVTPMIYFYDGLGADAEIRFAAAYNKNDPEVLSFGNSRHSCFRRPKGSNIDLSGLAGTWTHQRSDSAFNDESDIFDMGTMTIGEDGTYTYTDSFGKIASNGVLRTRCEEYADGTTLDMVEFVNGTRVDFTAYYNESEPDMLSLGNGGSMRFKRS